MPGPADAFDISATANVTMAPVAQPAPSRQQVFDAAMQGTQATGQTNSRSYYEADFYEQQSKWLNDHGYRFRTADGKMVPFGVPGQSMIYDPWLGYHAMGAQEVERQFWAAHDEARAKGQWKGPDRAQYEKQVGQRMAADAQQSAEVLSRASGVGAFLTTMAGGMVQGLHDPAQWALMGATGGAGALLGKVAEGGGMAARVASALAPRTTGAGVTSVGAITRATLASMAREGTVFAAGQVALNPLLNQNKDLAGIHHDAGTDAQDIGHAFLMGAGFGAVGSLAAPAARAVVAAAKGGASVAGGVSRAAIDRLYPHMPERMRDYMAARVEAAGTSEMRADMAGAVESARRSPAMTPEEEDTIRMGATHAMDAEANPFLGDQGAETHGGAMAAARSAAAMGRATPPTRPAAFGARARSNTLDPEIVAFFRGKGASEAQARGIAAGVSAESGNNFMAINPKSGAKGLGQWLGPRKDRLHEKYGLMPSKAQQLEHLWDELNGGDAGGRHVLAQTDERAVMDAYVRKFMRPKAGDETMGDLHRGMVALNRGEEAPVMGEDASGQWAAQQGFEDARLRIAAEGDALAQEVSASAREARERLDQPSVPPINPDMVGEHVPEMPALDTPGDKPVYPRMVDARELSAEPTFAFRSEASPAIGPAEYGAIDVFQHKDGRMVIVDGVQRAGAAINAATEGEAPLMLAHVMREADGWTMEDMRGARVVRNLIEGTVSEADRTRIFKANPGLRAIMEDMGYDPTAGRFGAGENPARGVERGGADGRMAGQRIGAGGGAGAAARGHSADERGGRADGPGPAGLNAAREFSDPHGAQAKAQADQLAHDWIRQEPTKEGEPPAPPPPEAQMPDLRTLKAEDLFAVGGEMQSMGSILGQMRKDAAAIEALRGCL